MDENGEGRHAPHVAFWVTLVRGILAIVLGVALVLNPDKARPMLANFMGMFWLVSGIMSLRWGATGHRARRLSLIAGVIGVLAGLLTITRPLIRGYVSETAAIGLLGGVMLLTGIIHAAGGFRTGEDATRQWSWTSFLLGVFEIILGAMLLISPLEIGSVAYWAASVWAFIGAFMLFGEALRQRAQHRREARMD